LRKRGGKFGKDGSGITKGRIENETNDAGIREKRGKEVPPREKSEG